MELSDHRTSRKPIRSTKISSGSLKVRPTEKSQSPSERSTWKTTVAAGTTLFSCGMVLRLAHPSWAASAVATFPRHTLPPIMHCGSGSIRTAPMLELVSRQSGTGDGRATNCLPRSETCKGPLVHLCFIKI